MTSEEFRAIRDTMKWTQADLAKMTGKRLNTISRYELGQLDIPQLLEIFMLLMRDKRNRRIVEKYL